MNEIYELEKARLLLEYRKELREGMDSLWEAFTDKKEYGKRIDEIDENLDIILGLRGE